MDSTKTQIGQVLEQVKMAMLAHTPVVYIPTDQLEVVEELLFGEETTDSLIPRVWYKPSEKSVSRLALDERGLVDETTGRFTSIVDNYIVGSVDPDSIRVPSILVSYVNDWNNISSNVKSFISAHIGIKSTRNYADPRHTDVVRRSLCIIVMAEEKRIPSDIAPYVKTVRIPPLSDEEIELKISACLREGEIPDGIISDKLKGQMIISFRGFSAKRIGQLLNQMIADQSIDFNKVDDAAVMSAIRSSKKQILENSQGLKWENANVSGVAGLGSITRWLTDRKEIFSDPERARHQHIDIPNGLLISGIPGSGKSLMAKTAATILDVPLISLDMGALLGGIMGESEHNMINALAMAEQMAPCVLWIDEIEKAFSGSSQGSSASDGGVGRRMFGKFLTWMQEKSAACFVFATSNDISSLPPELFRSERFDKKFFTFMPTARECAEIFAANIKAQNTAYKKELENMPLRLRQLQAKQLFDRSLEDPNFWIDVINDYCTSDISSCTLKDKNEGKKDEDGNVKEPLYVWSTTAKPKNKLMTGADISALIREAKFRIHPSPIAYNIPAIIYGKTQMRDAVRQIMRSPSYKPYGETNLKDIVNCFLKLHENEFVPASGQCIIDFDCYDNDSRTYQHDPNKSKWTNDYDRVLYYTIVGAINHYRSR